jgi:hypothetical protein
VARRWLGFLFVNGQKVKQGEKEWGERMSALSDASLESETGVTSSVLRPTRFNIQIILQ